jgi:hypothetical protein
MDFVEVGWGGEGWIGLAQDRDRWRALVNSVLNLKMLRNYRVSKELGISGVVLSSMEVVICHEDVWAVEVKLHHFLRLQ